VAIGQCKVLYIAIFNRKNELFGEVKVDIEYHRLCLCRTCYRDSCVGQWYFPGHVVCPTV